MPIYTSFFLLSHWPDAYYWSQHPWLRKTVIKQNLLEALSALGPRGPKEWMACPHNIHISMLIKHFTSTQTLRYFLNKSLNAVQFFVFGFWLQLMFSFRIAYSCSEIELAVIKRSWTVSRGWVWIYLFLYWIECESFLVAICCLFKQAKVDVKTIIRCQDC